jgi:hypothetical protein
MRMGFMRLESSAGIVGDGLPVGKAAPGWEQADLTGELRGTPTHSVWQLLIFTDYTIAAFPDLLHGIRLLAQNEHALEMLFIISTDRETSEATERGLSLHIPFVLVEQAFYDRFKVRVIPFVFFLDPQGIVRWAGLVNTSDQLFHIWRMVQVDVKGKKQ